MSTVRWVTPTYFMGQPIPAPHPPRQWQSEHPLGRSTRSPHTANPPKFRQSQMVRFSGGMGRILHHTPDSGSWTYIVEMELGPEPDIGRVGSETRILLHESDIQGVVA